MKGKSSKLPYFDLLIDLIENGNPVFENGFGKHVHWGYWSNPNEASNTLEDYRKATDQMDREIYSTANINEYQRLVDVGCGFGGTIDSINKCFNNLDLYGLNIDSIQLERANLNVKPMNSNSIKFIEGTASNLPFSDNSIDVVLAVESIFHFESRVKFLKEVYRILKPGGKLVFSDFVPTEYLLPEFWFDSRTLFEGFFGNFDFRYTLQKYIEQSNEIGFRNIFNKDVTLNTLPTYSFLWSLKKYIPIKYILHAMPEILLLELMSRTGLIRYQIISLMK